MAPFRVGHDELPHELPWLLMQNGPVTKYWRREYFEEDIAALPAFGFRAVRFDCEAWPDEYAMHGELRGGLGLPDYTGHSFDALRDSLTDMAVPESGGIVVALDNFKDSEPNRILLGALAGASRWWLLFGRMFATILRTDDPRYRGPADLGGVPANWNGREWFDAKRGL